MDYQEKPVRASDQNAPLKYSTQEDTKVKSSCNNSSTVREVIPTGSGWSSRQPSQDWPMDLLCNLLSHTSSDKKKHCHLDTEAEVTTTLSTEAAVGSFVIGENRSKHDTTDGLQSGKLSFVGSTIPQLLQHILPGLTTSECSQHIDSNVQWNSLRPGYASSGISEMKEVAVAEFNASLPITKKDSSRIQDTPSRYSSSGTDILPSISTPTSMLLNGTAGTGLSGRLAETANYRPFSLLYNECSLTAISNWACRGANITDEEQNTADSRTFHRPVASPTFRRCMHCNCWGHYDTECTRLCETDVIQLAESTEIQKTLCQFVRDDNSAPRHRHNNGKKCLDDSSLLQLGKDSHAGLPPSRANWFGGSAGTSTCIAGNTSDDAIQEDQNEDESLIRTNACKVCNSGFNSEDLLFCDGCGCSFHIQCLDPTLERIPVWGWFCDTCRAYDSDVSSVVELEGCDGFVIEQRRRFRHEQDALIEARKGDISLSRGHASWSAAFGVVPREMIPNITSSEMGKVADTEQSDDDSNCDVPVPDVSDLSVGELCWAKRGAAYLGMLGRDDWWPARVVSIDSSHQMPYLVKFFSLIGAHRVRPTAAIPFFVHYEEVGHSRLFDKGMAGYDVYRNALNAAVEEVGFKSLGQVLKRAREMNDIVSRGLGPSNAALNGVDRFKGKKRERPSKWNGADSTVVDGIEILYTAERDADVQNVEQEKQSSPRDVGGASTGIIGKAAAFKRRRTSESRSYSTIAVDETSTLIGLSAEQLLGGLVAWIGTTYQHPAHASSTAVAPKLNVGIGCSINAVSGQLLVRTVNGLDDLLLPKGRPVRVRITRASRSVREEVDPEPKLELHSIELGASLWIPVESLMLVDAAPKTTEIMTVMVPPGKLGITLADKTESKGTVVSAVRRSSRLADKISPGDRIIAIDGEDVSGMTSLEINAVISDQLTCARTLTVVGGGFSAARRMIVKNYCERRLIEALRSARRDKLQLQAAASAQREDGMIELTTREGSFPPTSEHRSTCSKANGIDRSNGNGTASHDVKGPSTPDRARPDAFVPSLKSPLKEGELHLGDGIYQAECILDEKVAWNKTEYLVKWRGTEETSWEPAAHILNQNLVNIFHASRALSQLRGTAEAKDGTSPTSRIVQALKKGERMLKKTTNNPTNPSRKTRICPWCYKQFKDGTAFGGHSNKHLSEPNYRMIKEVSKILERSWVE